MSVAGVCTCPGAGGHDPWCTLHGRDVQRFTPTPTPPETPPPAATAERLAVRARRRMIVDGVTMHRADWEIAEKQIVEAITMYADTRRAEDRATIEQQAAIIDALTAGQDAIGAVLRGEPVPRAFTERDGSEWPLATQVRERFDADRATIAGLQAIADVAVRWREMLREPCDACTDLGMLCDGHRDAQTDHIHALDRLTHRLTKRR